jgi:hypothetical protein
MAFRTTNLESNTNGIIRYFKCSTFEGFLYKLTHNLAELQTSHEFSEVYS